MASPDLNVVTPSPAHPLAKPGYGKRTAGMESDPRGPHDHACFAHLPAREACLAAFIDRLPEGAAMDVKILAKSQPHYGQQAVRAALRELTRAGHLRRVGGLCRHCDDRADPPRPPVSLLSPAEVTTAAARARSVLRGGGTAHSRRGPEGGWKKRRS